jgi:hypothetical protein
MHVSPEEASKSLVKVRNARLRLDTLMVASAWTWAEQWKWEERKRRGE